MMRENKTCRNIKWKDIPTEELDTILQAEINKESPDEKVVLPILSILEEREEGCSVENTEETSALLKKLDQHKEQPKRQTMKYGWIGGIIAATVVCIVLMAIPRTVGAESLFHVLIRWTNCIFEFADPDKEESQPKTDHEFVTDNPGLQQVHDTMVELGVTDPVVPMWIPSGYQLDKVIVHPISDGYKVNPVFVKDNSILSFVYNVSNHMVRSFEKENVDFDVYEVGEVEHFILNNESNLLVTWTIDGVSCSLSSDLPKSDVCKIIKSIYRREIT